MRKIINIFVIITLIVSILGTGIIVYIDSSTPLPEDTTTTNPTP